jgi:sugar O-acyltransferase (sialic acid O-acetyltransferase NeuD family)
MAEYLVYGAGGFAREVAWLADICGHTVVSFIDDAPDLPGALLNGIPVSTLDEAVSTFGTALVVGGIGSPGTREQTMTRAVAAGLRAGTLVHPRTEKSRWVEIGPGTVVCAGNILTTNITIGAHVQINLDCTVGHDVVMEDYVTLSPGVHISGWVRLARGSYIGTGANIINGTETHPLVIGARAIVGAGACVTKSVPAGSTVVGVPARPLSNS